MKQKDVDQIMERFLDLTDLSPYVSRRIEDMIEYTYYTGVVDGRIDSTIKPPPGTFELGEPRQEW